MKKGAASDTGQLEWSSWSLVHHMSLQQSISTIKCLLLQIQSPPLKHCTIWCHVCFNRPFGYFAKKYSDSIFNLIVVILQPPSCNPLVYATPAPTTTLPPPPPTTTTAQKTTTTTTTTTAPPGVKPTAPSNGTSGGQGGYDDKVASDGSSNGTFFFTNGFLGFCAKFCLANRRHYNWQHVTDLLVSLASSRSRNFNIIHCCD